MNIWAGLISTETKRRTRDNSDMAPGVIAALEQRPMSAAQIAEQIGRPKISVYQTLQRMESAVHVHDKQAGAGGRKEFVCALRGYE